MNIFSKILFTTLPLLILSLVAAFGTTYYFAYNALNDLAEDWLETRLTEALEVAKAQKDILNKYDLQGIVASVEKAELDASTEMKGIEIGKQGYIMVVGKSGVIAVHPDQSLIGENVKGKAWFKEIKAKTKGRVSVSFNGLKSLAIYDTFEPWGWYVLAVDPETEVYGTANHIKPYIFVLGILLTLLTALCLMLMTRRLTAPLKHLARGAERIGEGDLATRIPIQSRDEFGRLAGAFNSMAGQLEESHTALLHSEEYFRSLIENATDIIAILERDGTIIYGSPSMEKTLGYGIDDLVGKGFTEFVHQEDVKEFRKLSSELIENPEAVRFSELRFRNAAGSWQTLDVRGKNLMKNPAVSGIVLNIRDISERKMAEDALREAEGKYRGIFENAVEGIYRTTPDGRLMEANPALARMMGYDSPNEMLSATTNVTEQYYVDPEKRELFMRLLAEKGWVSGFENQVNKRNGTRIWTRENARAVRNRKGEVIFYEGSLVDVTEKKEMEKAERERKAAQAASRAKSQFLATMSHEIRTPMNAILGLSGLLRESPLNREQENYVKILQESCENLLHLINQVLDLSKVESGQMELDRIPFDLGELLERICEAMAVEVHGKNLQLTCRRVPPAPVKLIGDPMRLRQILDNLIGNAVKFTQEGEIQVGCVIPARGSHENGEIFFWVQDTGVGIPKDKQEKIFESFSQADTSTTREYGGTGLGLAIARRLVEMMGGRIWVESPIGPVCAEDPEKKEKGGTSRTNGQGSRFCFTARFGLLDTLDGDASGSSEVNGRDSFEPKVSGQMSASAGEKKKRALKILLVEDNKNNGMLFNFYLQKTPHHVDMAVNGKEGVEMYRNGEYDIVFMDMAMPVMDGYEATRTIRKWEVDKQVSPVPIIALTAHALEGTEKKSLDAGCTLHMAKPIKKAQLLQTIEKFL